MEHLQDFFQAIGGFKAVSGALGVSVFVALAVVFKIKKAVKEISEFVATLKMFITKYRGYFKDGQGARDYKELVKEADDALEAIADVLEKMKLKDQAKKIRELIELEKFINKSTGSKKK